MLSHSIGRQRCGSLFATSSSSLYYVSKQQGLWRDCAGSPEPSLFVFVVSTVYTLAQLPMMGNHDAGNNLNGYMKLFCHLLKVYVNIWLTTNRTIINYYCMVPKFSDRQVWANSIDPDQTAPRGAVWSGSTLFAILCTSFGQISKLWSHVVQMLGWLQQIFQGSEFFGILR